MTFELGYEGADCTLVTSDGLARPMRTRRWSAPPGRADELLLNACTGPVLDIGCGPGRLVAAFADRGVPALGVDTSPVAVRLCRDRNAAALRRSVFDRLPGEGRWREALLIDGNIGIGGDPHRLLRRVRGLLRPGGRAWVEVDPPGTAPWRGSARLVRGNARGAAFGWAIVGADAIGELAAATGFGPAVVVERHSRWFALLTAPDDAA
ncbi:class I SAM-dependent methyltransferase [Saccharopolyspora taberi]|uniref:Class I SAM-dependent methyltransferase n=1 Tax=Saccharopolyspora taberi TaxID=60895 RepID=A0ABN3VEU1_9PSEU